MAKKIQRKTRKKSISKSKNKNRISKALTKVHPWRLCPPGQHYRSATTVRPHIRKGKPVKGGPRSGTCADNPSGKDQLYSEEMQEIADQYFEEFKSKSLGTIEEFKNHKNLNAYDYLIRGWTKYWNDVLQPKELLDPKLVKALIASESGFNPNAWNKKKGPKRARGLTQVTDETLQFMTHRYNDFTDHFLNLTEDDMLDPNFAICAGIRWLYRKKSLASFKLKREATWVEGVAEYKSYLNSFLKNPNHTQMCRLIKMYEELKNAP